MMPSPRSLYLPLAGVAFLTIACGKSEPIAPSSPADGTYEGRGVVTVVEEASASGPARVSIHHESLPTFKNREGVVSGMESMAMTFEAKPGLDVNAVKAGDKIAFTFEVRWTGAPMLLVTKYTKLPPETVLILGDSHAGH